MTIRNPVLCADTVSLQHPELLGLEGESLGSQNWLAVFSDADEARSYARAAPCSLEVWVVGSDQMEGINLAAAIKHDRVDANVNLVAFTGGGSLLSRARAAGLNEVLDRGSFLNRYLLSKRAHEIMGSTMTGVISSGSSWPTIDTSINAMDVSGSSHPRAAAIPDPLYSGSFQRQIQQSNLQDVVTPDYVSGSASSPNADADRTKVMPAVAKEVTAKGYVLTVVGAGGGTGKSTIAALCACCSQESGRKTVIVDADLQFGDIAYLLGCTTPLHIDDLVDVPMRIEGMNREGRLPVVVAAPKRLERSELVAAHFSQIMSSLRKRFDVVIVNTGPTWSDLHMQLMEMSNGVLFLVDQRPSSLRACKHALDLCARCGIASQPFLFAINRCSRKALFSSIDVSCALQGVHVYELQDGGKTVEELLGTGQPFDLVDSGNPLAESVTKMMVELMPKSTEEVRDLVIPKRKRHFRSKRRAAS